jgi:hypothetical protein
MGLDKRLVLRLFKLILSALGHHIRSTTINPEDADAGFHQQHALNLVMEAKITLAAIIRQAGYKIEDLDRD